MRLRRPSRARGHLLIEAMAAGTIAAIALVGVLAGATRFEGELGQVVADQQALEYARKLVEDWRASGRTSSAWTAGAHPATPGTVPGTPWTYTVTVSAVSENLLSYSPVPSLSYRKASATVTYRGRTATLETLRW